MLNSAQSMECVSFGSEEPHFAVTNPEVCHKTPNRASFLASSLLDSTFRSRQLTLASSGASSGRRGSAGRKIPGTRGVGRARKRRDAAVEKIFGLREMLAITKSSHRQNAGRLALCLRTVCAVPPAGSPYQSNSYFSMLRGKTPRSQQPPLRLHIPLPFSCFFLNSPSNQADPNPGGVDNLPRTPGTHLDP
jgi:hypothetical protein